MAYGLLETRLYGKHSILEENELMQPNRVGTTCIEERYGKRLSEKGKRKGDDKKREGKKKRERDESIPDPNMDLTSIQPNTL